VLSTDLLKRLGLPTQLSTTGSALGGIGGLVGYAFVRTIIRLETADGSVANFQGDFPVFTDPAAGDMSLLGRDILNYFDVILSWRRQELLLLAANHDYRVEPP
jgi:hypothetical protein